MTRINLTNKDGRILIESPYSRTFIDRIKHLNGKWDPETKTWSVDQDLRKQVEKLIFDVYDYDVTGTMEKITIEYKAVDFYKNHEISIGGIILAYRNDRKFRVQLVDTAIISDDEFPSQGGSVKYPDIFDGKSEEYKNMILRSEIYKIYYDNLTEEEKSKVKIIKEESEIDILLREKEKLEKRLADINEQLESLQK